MAESKHITVAPDSERSRLASDMVVVGGIGFISGLRPVDLANERGDDSRESRSADAEDLCEPRRRS